jgi:hypothetical protein
MRSEALLSAPDASRNHRSVKLLSQSSSFHGVRFLTSAKSIRAPGPPRCDEADPGPAGPVSEATGGCRNRANSAVRQRKR